MSVRHARSKRKKRRGAGGDIGVLTGSEMKCARSAVRIAQRAVGMMLIDNSGRWNIIDQLNCGIVPEAEDQRLADPQAVRTERGQLTVQDHRNASRAVTRVNVLVSF